MITSPRTNLYQSDAGFSVEVLGQTGLQYSEARKKMFIDSEVLTGPTGMMVYRSSIERWAPPHNAEPVTEQKRQQIVENIKEVFRAQGFNIDVV